MEYNNCEPNKCVKQVEDFDIREAEWLKAKSLAAEYIEASDTLCKTIIKIALSKVMSREEKEVAIDNLTKSIGNLMSTMATEVLYYYGD